MSKFGLSSIAMAAAMVLAGMSPALAQGYPDRPVTVFVGVAPGGGSDSIARRLAKVLQEKWGQPVVVENRTGADGTIAAQLVADAKPDGYTLLFTANGLTLSAMTMDAGYDPIKDFSHITQIGTIPLVLSANPVMEVTDVKSMVELVKSKPDQYSAGASGSANATWHGINQFVNQTGMSVAVVPYKGQGAMTTALLAGEVQFGLSGIVGAFPQLQQNGGTLIPLAVTSAERSAMLPDVPTFKEALGLEHMEIWDGWYGVVAPAGTPDDIVQKLHTDIVEALNTEPLRSDLESDGVKIVGNDPATFKAVLEEHLKLYAELLAAK